MPIIILAIYGIAISIICAAFIFPAFRDKKIKNIADVTNNSFLTFCSHIQTLRQITRAESAKFSVNTRERVAALSAHRRWMMLALLIVALPAAMILIFKDRVDVGAYADTGVGVNSVVTALLDGERLVPPPPLPPEVFATREVIAERPALVDASRDWGLLDGVFQQKLLKVFLRMREQGYEMALIEGYRSPERQDRLAATGGSVTNAKAFQSYHQYGLAADCAFLRDGRLVISERDPWAMRGYELYGQEAEVAGLTWGGRWKMMDLGHVELRRTNARPAN